MGLEKLELNEAGIGELLRSPGVQADLARRAAAVAAHAGEGFYSASEVGPHRARAAAFTGTYAARLAEATERRLLRSLDAAR